ncbi:MAG: hypothetical protein SVM80_02290, partial [Halobacteriota archaeon]|nr:hypothetical protein [Halobacteriota archaeon]
ESNRKLGFKDYQMQNKKAIERFIQLVFTVWTALLSIELEKKTGQRGTNVKILGEEVDRIRTFGIIDMIKDVPDYFNLPYHEGMLLDKLRRMGLKLRKWSQFQRLRPHLI